jgi:hypothetical protein
MAKTKKLKKLRGKKELMYENLQKSMGNVTIASKNTGIDRSTHYIWLDKDENYKQWIEQIPEIVIDFVESSLFKNIKDGKETSAIFFLKTKAKHRGYVERQEIEHSGSTTLTVDDFREAYKKFKERQSNDTK